MDKDGKLLASTGVLETDKPLGELIDIVYAGLLDKEKGILEVLYSQKRAGADIIITYFAKEAAKYLK